MRGFNLQHGQIGHGAKPAEALTHDAPFAFILGIVRGQTFANGLAVSDDVVSTEVLEILGFFDSVAVASQSTSGDCRAETCSSLIQQ